MGKCAVTGASGCGMSIYKCDTKNKDGKNMIAEEFFYVTSPSSSTLISSSPFFLSYVSLLSFFSILPSPLLYCHAPSSHIDIQMGQSGQKNIMGQRAGQWMTGTGTGTGNWSDECDRCTWMMITIVIVIVIVIVILIITVLVNVR